MSTTHKKSFGVSKRTNKSVEIGWPGLWKNDPSGKSLEFRIPGHFLSQIETDQLEAWAAVTKGGKTPENWAAPDAEKIEELIPANSRVFRHQTVLREIDVIAGDHEFSLRLELARWNDDLPPNRAEWLAVFLDAANQNWPLVRFGISENGTAAVGEVNFTGAPENVLEPLLQPALDSFRWIVNGLVETAEFITCPDSESGALELSPSVVFAEKAKAA